MILKIGMLALAVYILYKGFGLFRPQCITTVDFGAYLCFDNINPVGDLSATW